MLTIGIYIWLIGLIILLVGFVLTTTEVEMKKTKPVAVVIAYIFWPVTLIAVIFHLIRNAPRRR